MGAHKRFRQGQILKLLAGESVASQDDLRRQLIHLGVRVTQATLSRDLRELRLVKTAAGYKPLAAAAAEESSAVHGLARALKEFLLDIRPAQNMLVLKTPPGGAQPLAAAVDSEHWKEVAGTLGGRRHGSDHHPVANGTCGDSEARGGDAPMNDPVRVAVVGATGYAGFELARLLLRHPQIEKPTFYLRDAHANVHCLTELYPQLRGWGEAPCKPLSVEAIAQSGAQAVFLSTPHEASLELVPALLAANPSLRIVDLSGAFRFRKPETFAEWYKLAAPDAATLSEAVYGLPELYADALPKARLVANPGCYPTSVILGAAASGGRRLDQHGARNRVRLQIRRQRRGQRTQARNAFCGSAWKFPSLRTFLAPPHAGSRGTHGLGVRKTSSSRRTCCRWSAGFFPPFICGWSRRAKRTKSKLSIASSLRKTPWFAFFRQDVCRNCSTLRTRISATSDLRSMLQASGWWWCPASIIWAKARQGKRYKISTGCGATPKRQVCYETGD